MHSLGLINFDSINEVTTLLLNNFISPYKILVAIFGLLVTIIPIFITFLKITYLNDFDRLFINKNERSIQRLVSTLSDYSLFILIYLLFTAYLIYLFEILPLDIIKNFASVFPWFEISLIILLVFSSGFIYISILINKYFQNRTRMSQLNSKLQSSVLLLNIIISLCFFFLLIVYSLKIDSISNIIILTLLYPPIKLITYKSFNNIKDNIYKIVFIDHQDLLELELILEYTFEDRLVMSEINSDFNIKKYVYDRSNDKYYLFIKQEN